MAERSDSGGFVDSLGASKSRIVRGTNLGATAVSEIGQLDRIMFHPVYNAFCGARIEYRRMSAWTVTTSTAGSWV